MTDGAKTGSSVALPAALNIAEDVDLRGLLFVFWRRRIFIIGVILVGVGLTFLALNFMPPRYSAQALVLIESANQNYGPKTSLKTSSPNTMVIATEQQILRSRSLAAKVIARLNEETGQKMATHTSRFKALSVYGSHFKSLPPEVVDPEIVDAVTAFLEDLNVQVLPGSFVVQIQFFASDPAKAALIANLLADIYVKDRGADAQQKLEKIMTLREYRREELRTRLQQQERNIEAYRMSNNLIEESDRGVRDDQFSELHTQLAKARADKSSLEAHLVHLRDVQRGTNALENIPEALISDIIRKLKIEAITLQRKLSELSERYGEKHPKMVEVRTELSQLNQSIQHEMSKSTEGIKNDVALAEARIRSLEDDIQSLRGQRFEDSAAMMGLRELEREVEATRVDLQNLSHNSDLDTYVQMPQARVISHAAIPSVPTFPNKDLMWPLSLLLSLFTALGLVLFMEKMNTAFRTGGQLERTFPYPCFGLIPQVKNLKVPHVAAYAVRHPSSPLAESVRALRIMLNIRNGGPETPKVVALTSSEPGEGKTTLSIWMARLAAKSGERVIVIDMDLHRPNVHCSVGQKNTPSIVEYLTGKAALKDVIQKDELSGADMMYARSVKGSALDLISSKKMAALIHDLKSEYDLILLDTPAALTFSDAQILAKMADRMLYIVSWNETPHEAVATGVKQFTDMKYEPLSFVLTNVDVKKRVRYGYGDAIYDGRYED